MIFIAENIPSIGYSTYFIIPGKINSKNLSEIKAGENFIENEFFKVTVDPDKGGAVTSIYDKENNCEVIDVKNFYGNVLISEKDFGDLYEFNGDSNGMATKNTLKIDKIPEKGKAEFSSDCRARLWLEIGPIMAEYTIKGTMEDIVYESTITLYKKIRRIDFKLSLNFTGKNKRIRLCIPLNVDQGKIFHEVPYGIAERGEGEYPAQNWVDYSNKKYGVSLINNGIPGNSIVQGVALLTLLRSVYRVLESHPAGEKALENGYHVFSYSLYPHKGDWVDGETYKVALEFNNPLISIKAASHTGKMPKKLSFVSASPQNIVITT
ncbi:MAG: glycoside hydrolase family 38 C-terminal domain-containing protein, partial [Candidatus Jordarchaeaceae archaeon]